MPKLSEYYIKVSLIYLLIGFTLGALLLAHKGIPYASELWNLLAIHVEAVLLGWILHLAMGVAYWMFPRFNPSTTGKNQRGNIKAAWSALILLNAGILVYSASIGLGQYTWGPLVGRSLEVAGVIAFVLNLWPRTKSVTEVS